MDKASRESELYKAREAEVGKIRNLREARLAHLEEIWADKKDKRESSLISAKKTFDSSIQWLRDALTMEEHPFVQVIAVLING